MRRIGTNKLQEKSKKMVFLGYPQGTKGFLLINPSTRYTVVSKNVIFYEEEVLNKQRLWDDSCGKVLDDDSYKWKSVGSSNQPECRKLDDCSRSPQKRTVITEIP